MKKYQIIAVAAFLAITAFLFWWYMPTQQVKRQTTALAESISIDSSDAKSVRVSKNSDFAQLLAPKFQAQITHPELPEIGSSIGKDNITEMHLGFANFCKSSQLELEITDIEKSDDTTIAVHADAKFQATAKSEDSRQAKGKLTLLWTKTDQGWRLLQMKLDAK